MVQGVSLISGTALVGTELGTVADAAYFTDVQEVARKASAVGAIKCMTGLSCSLVAWLLIGCGVNELVCRLKPNNGLGC